MGNPSASHLSAKKAKKLMDTFKQEIGTYCDFDWDCSTPLNPKQYQIIFTSCASESNAHVITRVCDAHLAKGIIPHIISSSIEHKSILETIKFHMSMKRCTATFVDPTPSGHILPADVESAITDKTSLITVMWANNETGAVNDIAKIGKIAHKHKIPFYTDAVQAFGKYCLKPLNSDVDGFAVSFHKFCGPVGVGLLVLKRQWIEGSEIKALIFGTQNDGLRGGTENVPGIAGSRIAFNIMRTNRDKKNTNMLLLKKFIVDELKSRAPCRSYEDYLKTDSKNEIEIIFFDSSLFSKTGKANNNYYSLYLPNTILLSVVKRSQPPMCNTRFKESLEKAGIIISVGSACNTSSAKASHVLYALGADDLIRAGALRISLGDNNTKQDCVKFVKAFLHILANCVKQNHLIK
jgi:cysteine desulfurase